MSQYITQLKVSLNEVEEKKHHEHGFSKIDVNLNKGTQGNRIFLWYKQGQDAAITRIQFSFTSEMGYGLESAGYNKIYRDLNTGARGDYVYLWYFRGTTEYDVPIVDLKVTTDAAEEVQLFQDIPRWERLACDLNRKTGGNQIHLWVKREKPTYICDVTVTHGFNYDVDNFKDGYIRVDEDTNRSAGGDYIYIWYRQTTDDKRGLKSLQISTNDEECQNFRRKNYEQVKVNLNQGTRTNLTYLWYKKDDPSIQGMSVIVNPKDELFEEAGVKIIKKDLNASGDTEYLCFNY